MTGKSIVEMEAFDVIIVGAGLAGLSAAHELSLRRKHVLILEADRHAGGKVITCRHADCVYERGALFAFAPDRVPFQVDAGALMQEDGPIGVFMGGNLFEGATVPECLQRIGMGHREALLTDHFLNSPNPQSRMIGASAAAALQAFFRVIHPGDLAEYVPARRRDGLTRHGVSSFQKGNAALIDAFLARIKADLRLGCRVTGLCADENGVTVNWQCADADHSARASGLILATPAAEARELTRAMASSATDFLGKIRYGCGITATIGLDGAAFKPFSYIVNPAGPVNTFVFRRHNLPPDHMVLTAYFVAEQAQAHWTHSDQAIVDRVISGLNDMDIGTVKEEHIRFRDVCRWPAVGPIISEEAYGGFSNSDLCASNRIVLAGDYTWWNSLQMPYGMQAAIESGKRAVALLEDAPSMNAVNHFQPAPLAISTISILTENGPEYSETVADGTIAYYGLLLKAEPDTELEHYLIGQAEDGLWSYDRGYGMTSLDTALVLEGLLSTGRHDALLRQSARRLTDLFFDQAVGGFRTLPRDGHGRAPYWQGVDCPSTAYCAWLLKMIDPDRYAPVIMSCAEYLRRKQYITGRWPGKWFPSASIPILYAVRLLTAAGERFGESCRRAHDWLCSRQTREGSWMHSVIETSAALLALHELGCSGEVIDKGQLWLINRRIGEGWRGEPILQYWFDEQGRRTFFHTCDIGRITTAWATMALHSNRQGAVIREKPPLSGENP